MNSRRVVLTETETEGADTGGCAGLDAVQLAVGAASVDAHRLAGVVERAVGTEVEQGVVAARADVHRAVVTLEGDLFVIAGKVLSTSKLLTTSTPSKTGFTMFWLSVHLTM